MQNLENLPTHTIESLIDAVYQLHNQARLTESEYARHDPETSRAEFLIAWKVGGVLTQLLDEIDPSSD